MRPFSIYLHIPYCRKKCLYCDFNVHIARRWPESDYCAALIAELEQAAARDPWRDRSAQTVFFGGGTPSLFAPASIAAVLTAIARLWAGPVRETTLEANPGTVTVDTLRALRAAGVTRLSLGVQSFDPRHLATLGRDHTPDEALAAVELARAAGFEDVSLDLIFAVPGQSPADWETDLRMALAQAPDHLSIYNLTYEERTAFFVMRAKGRLTPVSEANEAVMFGMAQDLLRNAGFRQYEISNYTRPGHESIHNINYWQSGEYLGVGAGAHSFARDREPGRRWSTETHPTRYLQRIQSDGHARAFEEDLTDRQARGEFVFLGLRMLNGFADADFADRFGSDVSTIFPHVATLQDDGLLSAECGRWRLTPRGLLIADSVFATFL